MLEVWRKGGEIEGGGRCREGPLELKWVDMCNFEPRLAPKFRCICPLADPGYQALKTKYIECDLYASVDSFIISEVLA
jgi:hypothetical protein